MKTMNITTSFSVSGKIKQIKSDGDLVYVEFDSAYVWPENEKDVIKTFSDEVVMEESERRQINTEKRDKYGTIGTKQAVGNVF